jgi:hypothetical protein
VTQWPFWTHYIRLWALAHALFKSHMSTHTLSTLPSISSHSLTILSNYPSFFPFQPLSLCHTKESSISSITPLTSKNYCSWADDIKSWLQLNGLWRLVSGLERKPAGRAEVRDAAGNVVTPAMSPDVRVFIMDYKDDPILIWQTLKMSFIQQRTALHFNAYHVLLSIQKSESELLEGLISRVDEHIRIIKSLSPSSFTLDNLYDELAVMAIIRALPHSFDNIICTISVLNKFDKQSVIQLLRNMDQMHTNLSGVIVD